MKQYEYAVFTVRLAYPGQIFDIDDWPDIPMQTALLVEMNRLGAEGWEIFERAYPRSMEPRPGQLFPYNLWARRIKQ